MIFILFVLICSPPNIFSSENSVYFSMSQHKKLFGVMPLGFDF